MRKFWPRWGGWRKDFSLLMFRSVSRRLPMAWLKLLAGKTAKPRCPRRKTAKWSRKPCASLAGRSDPYGARIDERTFTSGDEKPGKSVKEDSWHKGSGAWAIC